ncbi:MAG: hypothetical protein QOJ89_1031 [bacterium]
MRVSASMKSICQGQRAGRCSVQRRAVLVRRSGIANSRRRIVAAVRGVRSASPMMSVHLARLCARHAMLVLALLAL